MSQLDYREFVDLVTQSGILPFSDFVPEYPALTTAASHNNWHTGTDTDPWLWRIRIVQDGAAAYGKFFGTKASFIHVDFFPVVKTILASDRTVEERYQDGLLSASAYRIYKILREQGNVDSRQLRKQAGLDTKESKKEYDRALIELQNQGDVVITGSQESDNESGWSSMCYELSDDWMKSIPGSGRSLTIEEAKEQLREKLTKTCSGPAYKYFAKKMQL
ncbi:AlkZ-related protein [Paenibacillus spongiae]|uniref:Winged helix DNA-binding domain-containing protein n=1 Tax=Paenibacillus spongiae TaxID=2909671 RepID=A0ABY5SHG3_9BACL|nr:hypothetical protein [Paenibacillus spongiae]UVI33023.1 hypothetical protein L1F29_14810 [Paenibacillus spongiae]